MAHARHHSIRVSHFFFISGILPFIFILFIIISFPEQGTNIEFQVIGDTQKDIFTIRIYRGKINLKKYEVSARIFWNNVMLLELHIDPGKIHINPDGTKIAGSHWHIYTEKYGRKMAFPADDIQSDQFVRNTILFLDKFHVIEKPHINL